MSDQKQKNPGFLTRNPWVEVQLWSGQVQLRSIELDVGPPKSRQQIPPRGGTVKRGHFKRDGKFDSLNHSRGVQDRFVYKVE